MQFLGATFKRIRKVSAQPRPATADVCLVESIGRGDPQAEADFAERYHGRILILALRLIRDADAARDVTQETILAALIGLREGRLRDSDRLSPFVYGTARNLINNYVRSASRLKEDPLPEDLPASLEFPGCDFESRSLVQAALLELGARDREILHLTLVEQLKPGEIADKLELHPDVIRARKSRALKKIRQEIKSIITKRLAAATSNRGVA